MQHRRLGRSGLRVSEIALGSWLTLGSSVGPADAERLVRRALDLGIDTFDTADVYGEGAAEEALGRALRGTRRSRLVIASKAYFPVGDGANERGLSRKHLVESVEASLRRLGTDYLDLHQCHRYDPEVTLEETLRAYDDLVRQGKLLYWGVSEWSARQVSEAVELCRHLGLHRPISSQPQYSILARGIEAELLPACERAGVGQLVWSPLAQGVLTGKYRPGTRPSGTRAADDFTASFMDRFLSDDVLGRVDALRPLAEEAGLSMAQLALAWCLRQTGVASVIVGATRETQLEDNAAASGLSLPSTVVDGIDALFPPDAAQR